MTDPAPLHVDVARLVTFLLDHTELTPAEHTHVLECQQCSSLMATAAAEELQQRKVRDSRE